MQRKRFKSAMDRRVVNRIDFIQTFRDKEFHAFSEEELHDISTDFNYMYNRLQMLKNEQFSVFDFQKFIQHLQDNDFPAAQKSLEGALREYKLVLVLYDRLGQKKDEFRNDDKEDIMVKGLAAKKLKMDAPGLKDDVCKTFVQKIFWNLIPKDIDPTNEKLFTYALNCVDIVWFMCVQDPPISMSCVEKGDTFDTSLYRAYTKNGTKVDFCVWPLVLLADSGPVLTKGIVQGK